MSDPHYTPPVRLLSARIGADAPADGGALWQPSQLEVPDGADILRLRIGALDFAPAANLHYRYRMDGFDQGWIDNGTPARHHLHPTAARAATPSAPRPPTATAPGPGRN